MENKSTWARGMFISYSDFTEDGRKAFARGRATNIIGMTGQDLFFILDGDMSLAEVILRKTERARRARVKLDSTTFDSIGLLNYIVHIIKGKRFRTIKEA